MKGMTGMKRLLATTALLRVPLVRAPLVIMMLLLSTGCASIIAGKTQLIGINSNPDSAQISIKDEYGQAVFSGTTPTSILLAKGDGYFHGKDYTVDIAKDGYSKQVVTIKSSAGGWYLFGNIIFGGLIGWFIMILNLFRV